MPSFWSGNQVGERYLTSSFRSNTYSLSNARLGKFAPISIRCRNLRHDVLLLSVLIENKNKMFDIY